MPDRRQPPLLTVFQRGGLFVMGCLFLLGSLYFAYEDVRQQHVHTLYEVILRLGLLLAGLGMTIPNWTLKLLARLPWPTSWFRRWKGRP